VDPAGKAAASGCSDTREEPGTPAEPGSPAAEPDRPAAARHRQVVAQPAVLHKRAAGPAPARFRTREEEHTPAAALLVERTRVVERYTAAEQPPVRFHKLVERCKPAAAEARPVLLNKGPAEGCLVPSGRRRAR
jgi:hypothetical protein